jgi:hypothetical protein
MTEDEALVLTRYVKACCPQQAIDRYTPDAWYRLLKDLDFADCELAVETVAKRQPFVAPAEIRAEVKRLRDDRIARAFVPPPAPELTDDDLAYRKALTENIQAAAAGELPPVTDGPAIIGPPPGQRTGGAPLSLAAAITDLRREMGTAQTRGEIESPQEIAARQVAEHRAAEAERDKTEEAS